MPKKVGVVVLGNWGTALAQHLALHGHEVLGWSVDPLIVEGINREHRNPRFQSSAPLHPSLRATSRLEDLAKSEVLVLAAPSSALEEVAPAIPLFPGALWVSAIKGFVGNGSLTPLQFLRKHLAGRPRFGTESVRLAVLSGPSFAQDVVIQKPVGVVAAADTEEIAREVALTFGAESMRVYLSTDTLGVELGGILKNVIALSVGVSDGLQLGESAKAGLITRGLAEMVRLATAMGAEATTLFGLSGLGDLCMTATCDTSRNRTVGLRLGAGEKLAQVVESLGSTAEGVRSTPLVLELSKKYQVYMPICEAAGRLLAGQVTAREVLVDMMTRPPKREW